MSKRKSARAEPAAPGGVIERLPLADLPTPVGEYPVMHRARRHVVYVKLDNLTSDLYGGNKVRKLEYILPRARLRRRRRIATFGTAGSHHALATAIFAARLGYPCTCFLSHQRKAPGVAATLAQHLRLGTLLVPFGGGYASRIATLRRHLRGADALVVAPGGSSWQGTYGFVRAAAELAAQVGCGRLPEPDRLYVAAGTLGSAAGLAVGLALAGLRTEVHAVRVSHTWLCNEAALSRTLRKVVEMMRRSESSLPADLAGRVNVRLRHEFFAGGYAHTDAATEAAIAFASDQLGLTLEATYTGKAMAAMLSDLEDRDTAGQHVLFWNTYDPGRRLPAGESRDDRAALPPALRRYLD